VKEALVKATVLMETPFLGWVGSVSRRMMLAGSSALKKNHRVLAKREGKRVGSRSEEKSKVEKDNR